MSKRAVFLDRDGVLNHDTGYTFKPEDLRILPGIGQALSSLHAAGFLLVVVTNQSGVARGLFTLADVDRFHAAMDAELKRQGGVAPDAYYVCPHLVGPEAQVLEFVIDCPCRKPRPGLLLDAASAHKIDLANSYMVGDRSSDVAAAVAAGVKPIHIVGAGSKPDPNAAAHAASLLDAAAIITGFGPSAKS